MRRHAQVASMLSGRQEAKLAVIACSEPPERDARWNIRLLEDNLVKLDVVDSISGASVRKHLKKGISNHG